MKTNLLKFAAVMMVLVGGLASCTHSQQEHDENIHLEYLGLSPCNDNLKSTGIENEDSEYIKYSVSGNRMLKIEQKLFMNCCAEDIGITIITDENTVTVDMTDDDAGCNCICPKIATYEIANLKENDTYKFVFLRNGQKYHTCEILFIIDANGKIQL